MKLYTPESATFEISPTVDISRHGARVVTRNIWQPNQQVLVRSIRGNLYSRARVAYCHPQTDDVPGDRAAVNTYVVGLELYCRLGDWTKDGKLPPRP